MKSPPKESEIFKKLKLMKTKKLFVDLEPFWVINATQYSVNMAEASRLWIHKIRLTALLVNLSASVPGSS